MTRTGFDTALENLNEDLLRMGSIVEKQVHQCIVALVNQDEELAMQIIKNDDLVDDLQREIEDKCIRLIGKEQPLAIDLRTIFTISKIVTDLERMADHASNIAKAVKRLKNEVYIKELVDIPKMSLIVEKMIKKSLDSFISRDVEAIKEICKMDDEVDALYKGVFNDLLAIMAKDIKNLNQATQFILIASKLERIGDHVTNICEWNVYLVTGEHMDLNE
ncbi:MAG: phosphate transport system regulatory protein PhoU [Firmicutes bacterium]|nr:phosphate transport system regulatory protein PhoU [Bacillota bacterium]